MKLVAARSSCLDLVNTFLSNSSYSFTCVLYFLFGENLTNASNEWMFSLSRVASEECLQPSFLMNCVIWLMTWSLQLLLTHLKFTPSRTSFFPQQLHTSGSSTSTQFSSHFTTFKIFGMTSPERTTLTIAPILRPLSSMKSRLCNVALLTMTPPISTGSRIATGT